MAPRGPPRRPSFDPAHDDPLSHYPRRPRDSPLSSGDLDLPFGFAADPDADMRAPHPRPHDTRPDHPRPHDRGYAFADPDYDLPSAPDPPLPTHPTFMSTSTATDSGAPLSPPPPPLSPPPAPRARKRASMPTRDRARHAPRPGMGMSFASDPAPSFSHAGSASGASGGAADDARVDWSAARAAALHTPAGARVRFENVTAGLARHTVVVFVTQKCVETAALVYGRVAHLLQQAGARLVFVSPWAPEQAAAFLARFERVAPFPGTLLCDPDVQLYAACGFRRRALAALLPAIGHKPLRHGVRVAVGAAAHRAANRDLSATHARGAARVRTGAVVFANAKHPADVPLVVLRADESGDAGPGCYLDVLPACGVNGAFIPDLDIPHVIARFHNLRSKVLKTQAEDAREHAQAQARRPRAYG